LYNKNKKYISPEEALQKLQRYCAYQDRCHTEVRTKLLDLGVYGDTLEEIMAELITDNFLNEERFARSYVRGKFRIKQWGRVRIKQELKFKKISAYCLKKGLEEIEETEYLKTLNKLLTKKNKTLKEPDDFKRKAKLANYVIQKGYEPSIVWDMLRGFELAN
jgi:regulatory protein